MRYQKRLAKKSFIKTPKFIIIAVVIVAASTLAALELTNTTHIFHNKLASSTIPTKPSNDLTEDTTSPNPEAPQPAPPSQESTPPSPDEKSTNPPASGTELLAPSGNFASNHGPSLKDSPSIESVCTTTPGASCTITFTKNGITKTLEAKKADQHGSVVWSWDVKSAGFEAGSWKITATASLDGQTKSTADLQNLEVQP